MNENFGRCGGVRSATSSRAISLIHCGIARKATRTCPDDLIPEQQLWLSETEGAKFWLSCLTDLKNRGLQDLFIVCVDGLSGFAEAIRAAYPQAKVQLCIVHLVARP